MEAWSKMYQEKIINITTGEETIRPYTAKEIKEMEAANDAAMIELEAKANENKAKVAQRQAILEKLGITADEAAILLS